MSLHPGGSQNNTVTEPGYRAHIGGSSGIDRIIIVELFDYLFD